MATVTIETYALINSSTSLDLLTRQDLPKFTATIAMAPFTSGFKYDVTDTANRRDLSFTQGFFDKPSGSTASQFWS